MFETAQQEPSGGNTKVVAGVIVIVLAIVAGFYFMYIHGEEPVQQQSAAPAASAAQPANTPAADADFRMDLAIQRSNLGRDQTQTMAMWDLQITNRSREVTYRNLQYATNYYDAGGDVIYQGSGMLPGELAPGAVENYSEINDGLYPLTTARYTIELSNADGFVP